MSKMRAFDFDSGDQLVSQTNCKGGRTVLRLMDIITPKGIIPRLKAQSREEAIYEILEHLVETGRVSDQDIENLTVEIIKRESLGSTGIGHGVAIPHIKTDKVKDFVGALAVSEEGIEFKAIDAAPVKVIILFLSPVRAISGHLQLLSHIGGLLHHQGYLQLLTEAEGKEEFVDLVQDAERMIFGIGPGGDEMPPDEGPDPILH
jgi:mannitol/fructose-specific phosphotransferase system IIA component (Ntr-type)